MLLPLLWVSFSVCYYNKYFIFFLCRFVPFSFLLLFLFFLSFCVIIGYKMLLDPIQFSMAFEFNGHGYFQCGISENDWYKEIAKQHQKKTLVENTIKPKKGNEKHFSFSTRLVRTSSMLSKYSSLKSYNHKFEISSTALSHVAEVIFGIFGQIGIYYFTSLSLFFRLNGPKDECSMAQRAWSHLSEYLRNLPDQDLFLASSQIH